MTYSGVLSEFDFFAEFSTPQLAMIGATGREVGYSAGQRLFDESAPAFGCWLIERGYVDIDTMGPDGERVVVQTLGAGDVVGWSWLISPHLWHFGAATATDVSAILLDTDRLLRFMDAEPDLGYAFAKRVCGVLLQRLQASRAHALERPGPAAR